MVRVDEVVVLVEVDWLKNLNVTPKEENNNNFGTTRPALLVKISRNWYLNNS